MKNKWHDTIRMRLKKYRKECLSCLYPPNDYEWGTKRRNIKNTLALVNAIIKGIPIEAWPENDSIYHVANGRWSVDLGWESGWKRRLVDLKYRRNDHTAWCVESKKNPKRFIDFDIGGS